MSAQLKALTIQNGTTRRILDTSSLEVGLGINSAAGQQLTILSSDAAVASGLSGYALTVRAGAGDGVGAGGDASINGGTPGAAGVGGAAGGVFLSGAAAVGSDALGGTVGGYGGDSTGSQPGGDLEFIAGKGGNTSGVGGRALFQAGAGGTGGTGGLAIVYGGDAGTGGSTVGGAASVQGSSSGHTGGAVTVFGGGYHAFGPSATIGGTATIKGGDSALENNGADTFVLGGNHTGSGGGGGGSSVIRGGQGASIGFHGRVDIGLSNTSTTNISTTASGSANTNIGNGLVSGQNTVTIHAGSSANNGRFVIASRNMLFQSGGNYVIAVGSSNTAGDLNISAGSAASGDNNGRDLRLSGGDESGAAVGGSLYLNAGGDSFPGNVYMQYAQDIAISSQGNTFLRQNGADTLTILANSYFDSPSYPYLAEVESNAILRCINGGMIDLPAGFGINAGGIGNTTGYTVYANPLPNPGPNGQVTAANLNTLTAGAASDASTLHYHSTSPGGSASVVISMIADDPAFALGATVIAYAGVSGNAHNGNAGAPVFPVGFSGGDIVGLSSTAASGVAPYALPVQTSGILTGIPIGQFDLPAPTAAQRGARVYASTTTGKLTLTAPSGSGNFVQKVGVLTDVIGGTTANVDVQIGDMTILSP